MSIPVIGPGNGRDAASDGSQNPLSLDSRDHDDRLREQPDLIIGDAMTQT